MINLPKKPKKKNWNKGDGQTHRENYRIEGIEKYNQLQSN